MNRFMTPSQQIFEAVEIHLLNSWTFGGRLHQGLCWITG